MTECQCEYKDQRSPRKVTDRTGQIMHQVFKAGGNFTRKFPLLLLYLNVLT